MKLQSLFYLKIFRWKSNRKVFFSFLELGADIFCHLKITKSVRHANLIFCFVFVSFFFPTKSNFSFHVSSVFIDEFCVFRVLLLISGVRVFDQTKKQTLVKHFIAFPGVPIVHCTHNTYSTF